jgi:hypothetical protein
MGKAVAESDSYPPSDSDLSANPSLIRYQDCEGFELIFFVVSSGAPRRYRGDRKSKLGCKNRVTSFEIWWTRGDSNPDFLVANEKRNS